MCSEKCFLQRWGLGLSYKMFKFMINQTEENENNLKFFNERRKIGAKKKKLLLSVIVPVYNVKPIFRNVWTLC